MHLAGNIYWYPWTGLTENNCNAYLIDGDLRTVIDPGHEHLLPARIEEMRQDGFPPESIDLILLTHCHPDHLEGAASWPKGKPKTALHEAESAYLKGTGGAFYEAMGGSPPEFQPSFLLREGVLNLGSMTLEVIHTPGHSPGSVCYHLPSMKALITGDLLFKQGVGRTDFPEGSTKLLRESIAKVAELDYEWILPGHGEPVSGLGAVRENYAEVQSMLFTMM